MYTIILLNDEFHLMETILAVNITSYMYMGLHVNGHTIICIQYYIVEYYCSQQQVCVAWIYLTLYYSSSISNFNGHVMISQ